MKDLKQRVHYYREKGVSLNVFRNEDGAIDLASIMVGIIVIGLIGGVIAATVFAVIPWVQDNAAKQQLTSIASAESAYKGLSSSGTYAMPTGTTTNSFGDSEDLNAVSLLSTAPNYCVATIADGQHYIAFSMSDSGTLWASTDTNTKPAPFTSAIPPECAFVGPYKDPAPKLTSLTYRCDTTISERTHLQGTVTGTETWDDGLTQTYNKVTVPNRRTFEAGVTYTVRFEGTYTKFKNSFMSHCLRSVNHWGSETGVVDASEAFSNHTNLTDVPKHIPSTIKNMSRMFYAAGNFNDPDISDWDVSNVTDMYHMFYNLFEFNQPLDRWNTKNVTNMSYMFYYVPKFNQPIGNWDTGNVTNMSNMFASATAFNQPIGSWNTGNVTNMSNMFSSVPKFNQPIGGWNTGKVTNMSRMFRSATAFNQPIGSWNTENVADMNGMFNFATAFNQPIGSWNTGNVTKMHSMFDGASLFNQNINSWNTINVTTMNSMFNSASKFNQPLNLWKTGQVTTMASMFWSSSSFNQALNDWDVSNVTNMNSMFSGTKFSYPIDKWNTSKVTDMSRMFSATPSFQTDLSGWDTTSLITGTYFAHYSFPTAYLPPKTSL